MPADLLMVDWLPELLWRSGNLVILPGGSLHFCTSPITPDRSVRTVEWSGQEFVRGRKAIDFERLRDDGPIVIVSPRQLVAAIGVSILLMVAIRRRRHS